MKRYTHGSGVIFDYTDETLFVFNQGERKRAPNKNENMIHTALHIVWKHFKLVRFNAPRGTQSGELGKVSTSFHQAARRTAEKNHGGYF